MFKKLILIGLLATSVVAISAKESSALRISGGSGINFGSLILDGRAVAIKAGECTADEPCLVTGQLDNITAECECVNPAGNGVFPGQAFIRTKLVAQSFFSDQAEDILGKGSEEFLAVISDASIHQALQAGNVCQNRNWTVKTEAGVCQGDAQDYERPVCLIKETRMTLTVTSNLKGTATGQWLCTLNPLITIDDAPVCPADVSAIIGSNADPYDCVKLK